MSAGPTEQHNSRNTEVSVMTMLDQDSLQSAACDVIIDDVQVGGDK